MQKFVRFDFVNTTTAAAFQVARDSTLGSKNSELFLHQNSDALLFRTIDATGCFSAAATSTQKISSKTAALDLAALTKREEAAMALKGNDCEREGRALTLDENDDSSDEQRMKKASIWMKRQFSEA